MKIIKGDGTSEEFDIRKLEGSLKRSGASKDVALKTAQKVTKTIKDGMTTTEIYRSAYSALKKEEKMMAAKYSMRRAILGLGPTGFPFEDYFCELMRARGYKAVVRQIIQGRCSEHEVDVVFEKDGHSVGAELKFHNTVAFKTDLRTALYVRARFWDIEYGAKDRNEKCGIDEGWLVTNTKFTKHAISYAECAGIKLLGWNYPKTGNLDDMVKETRLYPVTVLTSLSKKEKMTLLSQSIVLCKQIANDPDILRRAGIVKKKHEAVIKESQAVCGV